MPIVDNQWDTKSNVEAEGAIAGRRRHDLSEAMNRPAQHVEGPEMEDDDADEGEPLEAEDENEPDDTDDTPPVAADFPLTESQLMSLTESAYNQGVEYQTTVLQARWKSSYNAFNSQHDSDSKYSSARYRGRSRLYRPKTRATVRKKMAEAAAALFATSDAIQITATDETDEFQAAGADIISHAVKYRLSREAENASVPWFMTCMGAHLSAQLTSICASMQTWEYRRTIEGYDEISTPVEMPLGPNGEMVTLGESITKQPRYRITRDRPKCTLYPPEDVIRDPGAPWEDQAQESSYLILRHPMSVNAAMTFIESSNEKSLLKFIDVPYATIAGAAGTTAAQPPAAEAVRKARETSGSDRYADHSVDKEFQTVWFHLNFMRLDGRDYCYWTLGPRRLISHVVPVEEAFPEQKGARPVTIGVSSLEPFKIDPMSPVESWRPMQQEANDLVNLRLDTVKQTIAPLAKVKRGRSVDIKAIQNRTPDSVVYMQDLTDVEFDRPGDVGQSSYVEMERLNADFDDLAGNFSIGSVQTNRSLGETVGGMKMMTSNANAAGEFDLRIFVETWVEPTLRQIVKLVQFYETDERILMLSAKKAKAFERMQQQGIPDDVMEQEVHVSCDVGIGASDPLMSLQKFQQAAQIALGMLGPDVMKDMKRDTVIDEVFGKAGYKDASTRFFRPGIEDDPRLQEAQAVIQKLMGALQEAEGAVADKKAEQDTKVKIANINASTAMAKQEMSNAASQQQRQSEVAQAQLQGPPDQGGAPAQTGAVADNGQGDDMARAVSEAVTAAMQPLVMALQQGMAAIAAQMAQAMSPQSPQSQQGPLP